MDAIKFSCKNILEDCLNNFTRRTQSLSKQRYPKPTFAKLCLENIANSATTHQLEGNERIIDKMKKKYHKKIKEASIKKTELGEDLETFTKEQFQKLQLIDDCQIRGINYKENPIYEEQVGQNMSAVDRLKKMAKIDDIRDEIKANLDWGNSKEKNHSSKCLLYKKKEQIFQRRSKKDTTSSFQISNDKNYQLSKLLNQKYSLNKYYNTLLAKNTLGINFLNSDAQWLRNKQDNVKKPSLDAKIVKIKEMANNSLESMMKGHNIYMTSERKSALYQCKILRLSKKHLDSKDYERLRLALKQKEQEEQSLKSEGESTTEKQEKECRAEQILEKNYNRIKYQRKRVIERLIY